MNKEVQTNCPDESVLEKIAAGVCPPEIESLTLQHAAQCNVCGPRLRRYMKIFSPAQPSDAEVALLNQLQTSRPERQRDWVRKNVMPPTSDHVFAQALKPVPWWRKLTGASAEMFRSLVWERPRMVMAGAALALAVFAVVEGPTIVGRLQIRSAKQDVALAFTQRRTTQMRITSAGYAPHNGFPVELGGESNRDLDTMSPALLAASKAVAENLQSGKTDPQWLQIEGRIFLWEATSSSLEKAAKDFAAAKSKGLNEPSLEIDLAASYFELDSRSEHPNLQRTLNLLNEVLSQAKLGEQDRATALYDLAISYEKTQAWDLAVSTWKKYLEVDSAGPWADDARQHLKDAESKIPAPRQQGYKEPLFFLDRFSHHNLNPEDPEEYQQIALSTWLPKAVGDQSGDDYRAVSKLAEVLEGHKDLWWKDFLKAMRAEDLPGVRDLNAAVRANERGDYPLAITNSLSAARIFSQNKNVPGNLRARFEEVYARKNLLSAECLARAGPLEQDLSSTQYRWLQAQLYFEKAQCSILHGAFAESDVDTQTSQTIAHNFGFPVLELRILGISASMNYQQGKCNEAWGQSMQGLERYWQGVYPSLRLDQFYSVMWLCAEDSGSLYTAEALLQHSLDLGIKNDFREGIRRLHLRNMYMSQKRDALADAEARKATSLLQASGQEQYQRVNDIQLAELQLQQGDPQRALSTMESAEAMLTTMQDDFISLRFYLVLGNVYLDLKRLDQAESAYKTAINVAEGPMGGLKGLDERIAWLHVADESYRGLVRVLLEQKKGQEALKSWEGYQSRPMFQVAHSAGNAADGNLLAKTSKTGSTALPVSADTRLVYANFKDGLQIWLVSGERVEGKWVSVSQQDFERVVRDFSEHCANPESSLDELHAQGQWLYSRLLLPVISALPQSQVVVVELDRPAYNLSLESLMTPDGWYFGEKYPVSYSPGMGMEQSLRLPTLVRPQEPLVLLDASHSPGAGYLPEMKEQRDTIARLFPRTKIVDSSSTSWPEARASLAASAVFHYMGHGKPDGTGTSLDYNGPQSSLRAKDFSPELLRRSQLVVVAACSSGRAKENGLWDSNSLVHAFLAAGVPRVIASHWNVDSTATSRLMISFYKHVASDQPVAQAVYEARKEILASKPHPYYWAGFSLTGRVN